MKYLKTSDIAREMGVHVNTVRLYEKLGFLPPIPRNQSGYRLFSQRHLDQMRLSKTVVKCTWFSGPIRHTALSIIMLSVSDKLKEALEQAETLLLLIKSEQRQAEEAVGFLEQWVQGRIDVNSDEQLAISEVSKLLEVSADVLRNWERNRLIIVPRNPNNGYRVYGKSELNRLRVIRTLSRAKYSTMSILRMLTHLDQGQKDGLRNILNTPSPEEDVLYATDRWISTLSDLELNARSIIEQLKRIN